MPGSSIQAVLIAEMMATTIPRLIVTHRAIFSFKDIFNLHVTIHGNRASTKSATMLKTRWETLMIDNLIIWILAPTISPNLDGIYCLVIYTETGHPPRVLIFGSTTVFGPIYKNFEDEENVEDDEGGYANKFLPASCHPQKGYCKCGFAPCLTGGSEAG